MEREYHKGEEVKYGDRVKVTGFYSTLGEGKVVKEVGNGYGTSYVVLFDRNAEEHTFYWVELIKIIKFQ